MYPTFFLNSATLLHSLHRKAISLCVRGVPVNYAMCSVVRVRV